MAPAHMRARYMGLLTLTYSAGAGIGPAIGGVLADAFSPPAMWFGAAAMAFVGAVAFALMARRGVRTTAL